MIYLASPYSDPNPLIVSERVRKVTLAAAYLIVKKGLTVFSPIVHGHALSLEVSLPTDAKFWSEYNNAMLAKADKMMILTLTGWVTSLGVSAEIKTCELLGLEVHLITPSEAGL